MDISIIISCISAIIAIFALLQIIKCCNLLDGERKMFEKAKTNVFKELYRKAKHFWETYIFRHSKLRHWLFPFAAICLILYLQNNFQLKQNEYVFSMCWLCVFTLFFSRKLFTHFSSIIPFRNSVDLESRILEIFRREDISHEEKHALKEIVIRKQNTQDIGKNILEASMTIAIAIVIGLCLYLFQFNN